MTDLTPAGDLAPTTGPELLDWYAYRMACCQWARDAATSRYAALLAQVDREEAYLRGTFGRAFEREVAAAINVQPGRAKSVKLGCATAGYRTTQGAVEIVDEAALLAEIARRPELAPMRRERTVVSVVKSVIRDHVENTGEELPGVRLEPAGEKFYMRAEFKQLLKTEEITKHEGH